MPDPGANKSKQLPVFEKLDRASVFSVAPTVNADPTRAGELPQASLFSFPPAMAYVTPSLIELVTALSRALDAPPPRLMFATAGVPAPWLPLTQSTPAMTSELAPLPSHPSTRTGTRRTDFATP